MTAYYFQGEMGPGNSSPSNNLEAVKKVVEYVPEFTVIQEALKFYEIEVHERTPEQPSIEGTLSDPKIRERIYETLVREVERGNTHPLEFILDGKILNKYELREYGIRSLKQAAEKILLGTVTGQQRARDINSFIEAGILTQDEVSALKTSSK